ncbi:hypothetical protein Gekk315_00049 [Aeromonas phage Gekk3-15]
MNCTINKGNRMQYASLSGLEGLFKSKVKSGDEFKIGFDTFKVLAVRPRINQVSFIKVVA